MVAYFQLQHLMGWPLADEMAGPVSGCKDV
jgi:hypothetical protein